jgi:hypothetical protein
MKLRLSISSLLILISTYIFADVWLPSQPRCYYSLNKKYCLKVFPTIIPHKYYKWKFAKPAKQRSFKACDTTILFCHATLYQINGTDSTVLWDKKLINQDSPLSVLVSDDGRYFITFDEWGFVGVGDHVMAVYNSKGEMPKKYGLEEISPIPIKDYFYQSVSGISWKCGTRFLNNSQIEICFRNGENGFLLRTYDLDKLVFLDFEK